MAIVDPGVGTARRAVAVSVSGGDGILIGPDNGLLATGVALAGGGEAAFELNKPEYHLAAPGTTFAGRDIFASVAAHLCNGVPLSEVGTEIDVASILPGIVPVPREEHGKMLAEVTWVDHFGNCQLNVGPDEIAHMGSPVLVTIGSLTAATAGQQPVVRWCRLSETFQRLVQALVLLSTRSACWPSASTAARPRNNWISTPPNLLSSNPTRRLARALLLQCKSARSKLRVRQGRNLFPCAQQPRWPSACYSSQFLLLACCRLCGDNKQ